MVVGAHASAPGAFFVPTDAGLAPTPDARSPWAPDMLHGRLLAGLAVREVERAHATDRLRIARVTTDLYRFPPMAPLRTTSRVVREGRRIRIVDAEVTTAAGDSLARSTVVQLLVGVQPDDRPEAAPPWDVPAPGTLPTPPPNGFPMEIRPAPGSGFNAAGPRRVWLRDHLALVRGEEPTAAQRAVLAADLASPLSHGGTSGLAFINADITLYLARLPVGPWIGLEVTGHVSADGIATGQCRLHDEQGPIGYSVTCALANAPMPRPADPG